MRGKMFFAILSDKFVGKFGKDNATNTKSPTFKLTCIKLIANH